MSEWKDMSRLRMAAMTLLDAKKVRMATSNRVGAYERLYDTAGDKKLLSMAGEWMNLAATEREDALADKVREYYAEDVPLKVRAWATEVPYLASGELFPLLIGLIGNPRHAVPLKLVGAGAKRHLEPDGDPYDRDDIRQLWSWCGIGDPGRVPQKKTDLIALGLDPQKEMLALGRRTTVRPLLYTWSSRLVMASRPVTKQDSRKFGLPTSEVAASSDYFRAFTARRAETAGHEGKCDPGTWPTPCAKLHVHRHERVCRNTHRPPLSPNGCGTTEHPEWGEVGSVWRPGHCESDALRYIQKMMLRDLYRISPN